MTARLAVVTALPDEAAPLLRRIAARRLVADVWSSSLGHCDVRVVVTGVATPVSSWGDDGWRPDLVLGAGLAGAVSPDLATGDVVVAGTLAGGGVPDAEWTRRAASRGARSGTVIPVPRLVTSVREKNELHARHGSLEAAIVDMESAIWTSAFDRAGIPWIVVRAVADTADDELPAFLADCVAAPGGISRARVLRHALASPSSVPALLRLRRDVAVATLRLGDVVAGIARGN